MENQEIRDRARIENVKFWMIAKEIGIVPGTLTVWLRSELPAERKKLVNDAIDAIIKRRAQ